MFGINLNAVLPMRAQANERSEMTTQLLFGEHFRILEEEEKFLFVENANDAYQGWVDKKMCTALEPSMAELLAMETPFICRHPLVSCQLAYGEKMTLSGSSMLPFYNLQESCAHIANKSFYVSPVDVSQITQTNADNIIATAKQYLHAPYLWGGKTLMGIDCSALVQVSFGINGIRLPRDARQQVEEGESVATLNDARTGDLVFFSNEQGAIVHVGILIEKNTVIHASGKVKIEKIDETGIINKDTDEYSHHLSMIRRIRGISK